MDDDVCKEGSSTVPVPVNAWGKKLDVSESCAIQEVGTHSTARVTRFSDIMEQQQTDELLETEVKNIQYANVNESEEERQLRLAIEASLFDCETDEKLVNDGDKKPNGLKEEEDDMDEEMRLVLAMSLSEANLSTTTTTIPPSSSEYASKSTEDNNILLNGSNSENGNNVHSSLSEEEARLIALAIREADDADHALSLELAMKLEKEEKNTVGKRYTHSQHPTQQRLQRDSNVKLVTRSEYLQQKEELNFSYQSTPRKLMGSDYDEMQDDDIDENYENDENLYDHEEPDIGFRLNTNNKNNNHQKMASSPAWTRSQKNHTIIVGPNGEMRSKHDVELKSKSNAQRLLSHQNLEYRSGNKKSISSTPSINDRAYNDFMKKMKQTKKGVATHGHGRAENMGDDKTRGGALDGNVRMEIQKAINSGLIDGMNGVVKEGKEALVYHADASDREISVGTCHVNTGNSGVAVKIFKRIQEFRQRGAYVNGDPRYHKVKFGKQDKRNQVEIWAEKEYRNLIRANRAGVPTPIPLLHRQNILFMTFLGENGWPSPQLREIKIKYKSRKWTNFYCRTMIAVRRLYHLARLVHGDLSEYNILVCPSHQIQPSTKTSSDKKIDTKHTDLQIVLIDFGQAVERGHPNSSDLLRRDLGRVETFFKSQGASVLDLDTSLEFIVNPCEYKVEAQEDSSCLLHNESQKAELITETETPTGVVNETIDKSCKIESKDVIKESINAAKQASEENIVKNMTILNEDKESWRHSIPSWDDDKDLDRLIDLIHSQSKPSS